MASASVKSFEVDITAGTSIKITPNPTASFAPEFIAVQSIKSITPIFYDYTVGLGMVSEAITGYTAAPNTISIAGDYVDSIAPGSSVVISGSTNNDGTYTVISASYDGVNTTITVVEAINPAVVDGNLSFTAAGTVENNQSGAQFGETYPYPRLTVIAIELWDDSIVRLELQSITNQATWSTGNLAGLIAASTDLGALL